MLHLARKAFFPGPLPFPLLHVDTTWKFRDMYASATGSRRSRAIELIVHQQPRGAGARGSTRSTTGRCTPTCGRRRGSGRRSTRTASTRRSAAPGATRRRAAPRSGCSASATATTAGTRSGSGRSCGRSTMSAKNKGESMRVFPLSNWTELDVWQYILREGIEVVPLYFAAERPTVERDGLILMVDDERMRLEPGEEAVSRARCGSGRSAATRCRARSRATRRASRRSSPRCSQLDQRAAGPRDRPRRRQREHGEEEAGGLFLNAPADIKSLARRAGEARSCCASSPAAASTTASRR